jgi:hypothetical protein
MYLYCTLALLICALQAVITCLVIYHSPSNFIKLLCYPTLGGCFVVTLISATCALAVVQKQLDGFLPRNTGAKCLLVALVIAVGLPFYLVLQAIMEKDMWFFYGYLCGLIGQFWVSWHWNLRPCWHFIKMYVVGILYLAFLTDQYPISNFHEHSIAELTGFTIITGVVVLVGWFFMRKTKQKEDIAVMFEMKSEQKPEKKEPSNQENENKASEANINNDEHQIKTEL